MRLAVAARLQPPIESRGKVEEHGVWGMEVEGAGGGAFERPHKNGNI